MRQTAVTCVASLFAFGLLALAQPPSSDPKLRAATAAAIQEARSLRKIQESLSIAMADNKATPAMLAERIAATGKSLQSLQDSIDKIDEQYESLSEDHQSAVREAWSLAKLFGVLFEHLQESAAKPDSAERRQDLISDCGSTARRAVMLDETLSRLNSGARPRG